MQLGYLEKRRKGEGEEEGGEIDGKINPDWGKGRGIERERLSEWIMQGEKEQERIYITVQILSQFKQKKQWSQVGHDDKIGQDGQKSNLKTAKNFGKHIQNFMSTSRRIYVWHTVKAKQSKAQKNY